MPHVKKIAVVGATGSIGKFITAALLRTGEHEVTAITRTESKASEEMPEGVRVARVDYDDRESLVAALRGQEVLVITMGVRAPQEAHLALVDAAADAGVAWVVPNDWGGDVANERLRAESMFGDTSRAVRRRIEERGVSGWVAFCSNFWYEFSLGGTQERYGFDFAGRSVVFFDDGRQRVNTTTWPQSGLAVARLLSLKTSPDGPGDESPTLSGYRHKYVYISSFCVSQRDMFESMLRVTGTKEEDWKITYENSRERYQNALKMLKEGDRKAFARVMYTRIFFPDGLGIYETTRGLDNDVLGLPKEDLDESTKIAVEMSKDFQY